MSSLVSSEALPPSPARRRWLFGAVAAGAAVTGAGGAWWRHRLAPVTDDALGADFWGQTFDRPEGGVLSFDSLRGKPVLLNFWATWCPPCVEELPMIDRFFREQASNGWQVVGLAIDQPSAVRKFLARAPVGFPVGLAGLQGTEWVRRLGNPGGGLPFTIVLGADGVVRDRKIGQLQPADLVRWQPAGIAG